MICQLCNTAGHSALSCKQSPITFPAASNYSYFTELIYETVVPANENKENSPTSNFTDHKKEKV